VVASYDARGAGGLSSGCEAHRAPAGSTNPLGARCSTKSCDGGRLPSRAGIGYLFWCGGRFRYVAPVATLRPLATLVTLLLACARTHAAPHRAPQAPVPPPPADVAPRCGPDPHAPWLDPAHRACRSDLECFHFEGSGCEMIAVSAARLRRGDYDAHRCPPVDRAPDASPYCLCSIPLTEQRCHHGCCQLRIAGSEGLWWPPEP